LIPLAFLRDTAGAEDLATLGAQLQDWHKSDNLNEELICWTRIEARRLLDRWKYEAGTFHQVPEQKDESQ